MRVSTHTHARTHTHTHTHTAHTLIRAHEHTHSYEDGANVSELETLIKIAAELGIPNAETYLTSEEDIVLVQKQAREASGMGISGVPFFVAYNSADDSSEPVTMSGAQPPKAFVQCIRQLATA